eukprot:RCo018570
MEAFFLSSSTTGHGCGVQPPSIDRIKDFEDRLRKRPTPGLLGMDPDGGAAFHGAVSSATATAENSLDSEVWGLQQQVRSLEGQLRERDALVAAKDDRIRALEVSLRSREAELASSERLHRETTDRLLGFSRKLQAELVERIRSLCRLEREGERAKMYKSFYKLGQVVAQRDMSEVWVDGRHFTELKAKMESNREEMEQLKKRTRKRARAEDDPEADEEEEMLQLHLSNLKKEEAALQAELEALEGRKMVFIRDVRRLRGEDQSKFSRSPVLHNRYVLERMVGKGGFSEVFQAFDLVDLRTVACKIHQLNPRWAAERRANYLRHARREYEIHRDLNHPRVVKLYDMFEIDAETFATVLEFCPGIDLDLYLKKNKFIPEKDAKRVMSQVFGCLKYLNEQPQPIIHYDLKPGNILLSPSMEVKVTDFGLSKIIPEEETHIDLTSQGAGTYWYLPPECFQTGSVPKISAKVDVWAAGVIFYQVLFGRKPFGNDASQQQLVTERIILNAHTVEFPSKPPVSSETKDFVRRLLVHSQAERPDIFAVCADPYFALPSAGTKRSKRGAGSSSSSSSATTTTLPTPPGAAATTSTVTATATASSAQQAQLFLQPSLMMPPPPNSPPPITRVGPAVQPLLTP